MCAALLEILNECCAVRNGECMYIVQCTVCRPIRNIKCIVRFQKWKMYGALFNVFNVGNCNIVFQAILDTQHCSKRLSNV